MNDQASNSKPGQPTGVSLDQIPLLIGAAFDTAKSRGKVDWQRMTTAVLKNRLLQMTERAFDEQTLGFSSLDQLLTRFPELVRLDHTTRPTSVVFLGEATTPMVTGVVPRSARMRVREDLWNALMNYSAGHSWVWDRAKGEARAAREDDVEPLIMPTVSSEELAGLRSSFALEIDGSLTDQGRERVQRWQAQGLGTAALPPVVQGRWNEYLKSTVVNRLSEWFERHKIPMPGDLLRADAGQVAHQTDEELAKLRALVIDCVRSMTLAELASLNLPAGAILRVQTQRGGRRDAT